MTSCKMTQEGAEKCSISNTPLLEYLANFSMCCIKLSKNVSNSKEIHSKQVKYSRIFDISSLILSH